MRRLKRGLRPPSPSSRRCKARSPRRGRRSTGRPIATGSQSHGLRPESGKSHKIERRRLSKPRGRERGDLWAPCRSARNEQGCDGRSARNATEPRGHPSPTRAARKPSKHRRRSAIIGLASAVSRASITSRLSSQPARLTLAERNVSHDRLWAPWRLGYIQGKDPPAAPEREVEWLPGADQKCFLCLGAAGGEDRANLVVARGKHTLVVLNRFPYNNG